MLRDPRKLLYDVAAAAEALREFCRNKTIEEYEASLLLRSACERQFEIIGEAMTRLRNQHPETFDSVAVGDAIIGFRNRLIHGYDSVDSRIVWDVIQNKLPPLHAAVRRLLPESF
jgi:uncharacterized protein with HEPN domain